MKTVVVFYSLEGNTRFVSQIIKEKIDAELLELKTVQDISSLGFLKYPVGGFQAIFGIRPELEKFTFDPEAYDFLIFGTPVWAGKNVPAFNTFFSKVSVKGKKVAVFATSGGDSRGVVKDFGNLLKGNEIFTGENFINTKRDKENTEKKVDNWLRSLNLM